MPAFGNYSDLMHFLENLNQKTATNGSRHDQNDQAGDESDQGKGVMIRNDRSTVSAQTAVDRAQ